MNAIALQLLAGLALSTAIGWLAYQRQSLTTSGVAGAIFTGTVIFGLGGWLWGILLIVFFATSSALSHYRDRDKQKVAEKFSKGSRRDLGQALANAGVGTLLAAASVVWPNPLWFATFVGAMATVNADTWATELGVLSRAQPRLVTTGKAVEPGASGGVTWLGVGAAAAGAGVIGVVAGAGIALGLAPGSLALLPLAMVSGVAGSLFDSLLGATVQAIYFCKACGKETERTVHSCGQPARRVRGWPWLDNDRVNFLASVVGAGLLALLALLASAVPR